MNFKSQIIGEILVLTIYLSKATSEIADALKSKLTDEVSRGYARIVLSLEYVDFTDSSFLGALLAGQKVALEKKGTILLCGLKPQVKKVFEVTYMNKIFGIFESVEKALADFNE